MRDWPQRPVPEHEIAVFLDRDGTINRDTHYPHRPEALEVLPGALEALAEIAALPVHVIVVTNQSGIALGRYDVPAMSAFNEALRCRVERAGGRIDAFYYCPHREHKDLGIGESPCGCSKPAPGMLIEAARDFGVNLAGSYMVGDKSSDIEAGTTAGCTTILVRTGKAGREDGALRARPDVIVDDLMQAARWLERALDGAFDGAETKRELKDLVVPLAGRD